MRAKGTAASQPVPPSTLEEIPGLGVVRARGLRKAGILSVAALRRTSPELIAEAPGLSMIKATQVLAYLSQFDPESLAHADEENAWKAGAIRETQALLKTFEQFAVASNSSLVIGASRAAIESITLLLSPAAKGYRGKLMRELSHYAQLMQNLLTYSGSMKNCERLLKLIRSLENDMLLAVTHQEIDKKFQNSLADSLAAISGQITDILTKERT